MVNIDPLKCRIDYTKRGLSLGSCFASELTLKLRRLFLPVTVNPFGTLYNPLSVADAIIRLASGEQFSEDDLCFDGELWHSFSHHHSFNSTDKIQMLETINSAFKQGVEALQKADYVIITLGTTRIFRHIDSNRTVANCHKFPATFFVQERLDVKQTVEPLEQIFNTILADKSVILSVSPIRYYNYGLADNSLNKAIIRMAVEELCKRCPNVEYFPAYEIMIDELRDYHYYKPDTVHPTDRAVEYIARRFLDATMDTETLDLVTKVKNIVIAMEYKPIDPTTEDFARFRSDIRLRIEEFRKSHPEVDFLM